MRKTLSVAVAAIFVLSLILAGCSSNKEDGNVANTASPNNTGGQAGSDAAAEKVTMNVFANHDTNIDLEANSFTKFMEDKFNIQINWTVVPKEGAPEKRKISLASGELPDLYFLIDFIDKFTQAEVLSLSKQGVIIPLNDLIDQYAPNIKQVLDSNPVYKAVLTAPDGNIYAMSKLNECFHCSYQNKMWLNTTWLKQLGLSEPKTTEEFRNVLRAFKTQDPNGNDKADEIPLSGSKEDFGVRVIPYLMNGFIYNDDKTYLTMKDGKVDTAANKPEWKEGLAYVKSLYDEGLIDIGSFTQDAETFKKLGDNDPQLLGAGTALLSGIFIDIASNPSLKDYNPIAPLQGPHASYATYNNTVQFAGTFVLTNKASKEVQIAAIKMLDYLYTTEGRLRSAEGEEGVSWLKPEAGDVALNEKVQPLLKRIPLEPDEEPRNDSWGGALAAYNADKAFRDALVQGEDIYASDGSGLERQLYQATMLYDGKQPKEVYPNGALWVDPANADELSMLQTNIKDYVEQNALQFVTGSKSLDKDWDAYVKGLDRLNLKRYLEIMQASYDSSTLKK